jgi:hypothetical protein
MANTMIPAEKSATRFAAEVSPGHHLLSVPEYLEDDHVVQCLSPSCHLRIIKKRIYTLLLRQVPKNLEATTLITRAPLDSFRELRCKQW